MINRFSLTILVDDSAGGSGLPAEHGLSIWIEADNRRILFDTGQSDLLLGNADKLGIDLREADSIVLSHGHYDHTGGLVPVMRLNPSLRIYAHPGVILPRYRLKPDRPGRAIQMREDAVVKVQEEAGRVRWVTEPLDVSEGIGLTGPIPRRTSYEDVGGAFYLDREGKRPDPIEDDLALWFPTKDGLVVVTGCCHSGIVNTLVHIRDLTGGIPFHTILGGFHLLDASSERIQATCDDLRSIPVRRIVPCHCTGDGAVARLSALWPRIVFKGSVGRREGPDRHP
jgi:7,8-dihydropterin-6-yl-methyl-4-(beta-D-ribofuranosyl)aminobenzene 5'-phosphate synthase